MKKYKIKIYLYEYLKKILADSYKNQTRVAGARNLSGVGGKIPCPKDMKV